MARASQGLEVIPQEAGKRGPKTGPETRQRLVDVAERLFAEEGIESVSLRRIMDEAGVGLSQLNYHFGTKKDLIRAIYARKVDRMTGERLALLAEAEKADGTEDRLAGIVRAYLLPPFEMYKRSEDRKFAIFGAHIATGSSALTKELSRELFDDIHQRFVNALRAALPQTSTPALYWRLHLMLSLLIQTLAHPDRIKGLSGGACEPLETQDMMDHLVPMLVAALQVESPGARRKRPPAKRR